MTVKFKEGAISDQLKRMRSGTGRMRDATGLTPAQIQSVLKKNEAPEDVAEIIVGYVGQGVLSSGSKIEKKEPVVEEKVEAEEPVDVDADTTAEDTSLPEIDLTMSVKNIVAKIVSGEWPADAVKELESQQEKPRGTLLAEIEKLEE